MLKGLCHDCFTSNVPLHIFPLDNIPRCKKCYDKMGNEKLEEIAKKEQEEKVHCENCNCKKDIVESMEIIEGLEKVENGG